MSYQVCRVCLKEKRMPENAKACRVCAKKIQRYTQRKNLNFISLLEARKIVFS